VQCGREVTHADTRANRRARIRCARVYTCVYTPDRPPDRFTRPGFNPGNDGTVAGQSVVKRCEQWHFGVSRTRTADANRSYVSYEVTVISFLNFHAINQRAKNELSTSLDLGIRMSKTRVQLERYNFKIRIKIIWLSKTSSTLFRKRNG